MKQEKPKKMPPMRFDGSDYDTFKLLEDEAGTEAVAHVFMALLEDVAGVKSGREQEFNPVQKMLYMVQRAKYADDAEKYLNKCEQNRKSQLKRWEQSKNDDMHVDDERITDDVRSTDSVTPEDDISSECKFLCQCAKENGFDKIPTAMRTGIKHALTVMNAVVIQEAISDAASSNGANWKYLSTILERYERDGIRTMADVNADRENHRNRAKNASGSIPAIQIPVDID